MVLLYIKEQCVLRWHIFKADTYKKYFNNTSFAAAHDDDDEQERISKRNSTSQQDIRPSTQFSD